MCALTHKNPSVYYCCNRIVRICQFEGEMCIFLLNSLPYDILSFVGWNKELKKDSYISHYYEIVEGSHITSRLIDYDNSVFDNGSSKIPTIQMCKFITDLATIF